MTFSEAPLSVNFKPSKDYDAPMLTIRASTPPELTERVGGLEPSGVFTSISDADAKFKAAYAPSAGAQNAAAVLGAQTVAVQPQTQPVAPAAPTGVAAGQWGAQPTPQWGAQAAAPAAPAAPVATAPSPAASAGAPFIPAFNQSATFRSGNGARGPWSAYLDPRPKQVTDMLPVNPSTGKVETTDDVNHPGLAAGTHKFAKFLR